MALREQKRENTTSWMGGQDVNERDGIKVADFNEVKMNTSLIEAIKQTPAYAQYFQELYA